MKTSSLLIALIATSNLGVWFVAPARAQATRTWVSGVGDDANPCSRTAPCKTFAGAISKTAPSGEINCLDPGGFGAVTITKAIAIICQTGTAGVLVSGTNGITVNAGSSDVVYLSGLDIEGIGVGLNGVQFIAGAALHIQDSIIRGFTTAAPNGNGILFSPVASANLSVVSSTIANNGVGVEVRPTGSGQTQVAIASVHANQNATGIRGNGTASTGIITISVNKSDANENAGAGFNATSGSGQSTELMLNQVVSAYNGTGVRVTGGIVRLGNSVITGNGVGTSVVNSGVLSSYGNNQINDNAADGPNPPIIPLK